MFKKGDPSTTEPKTARLHSLDFLRGLFLIVILVNHIALFPNLFMFFTGKSQLWMSAAEGFMAVSGLLIGYIYTRKIAKNPAGTTKKVLGRALKVYIATILLGIFCMLFIYFIDPVPVEEIRFLAMIKEDGLLNFILSVFNLSFAFHWAEFLSNYAIFIALAPLALWFIAKKKAWVVALASVGLWAAALTLPVGDTVFVRSSWQILFFISMIIGAYLTPIRALVDKKLSKKQKKASLYALWISAVLIYIAAFFFTWGYSFITNNVISLNGTFFQTASDWWWRMGVAEGTLFDKAHLGILRLATGAIVFWALFTFTEAHLSKLNKFTGNIIERTGKNGLAAYVIHSIIALVVLALPPFDSGSRAVDMIVNTLSTALCIYLLYILTYKLDLYTKPLRTIVKKIFYRA